MPGYDIGPRIGIKGETEFNKQIKKINNSLREYGSEMKALTSEFEENENSQQALIAKSKLLEKQLDAQKQKMSVLQDQYDKEVSKLRELATEYQRVKTEMGENSAEAGKAEAAYNKQAESVSKLKVAMNETQNYINQLNTSIDKNATMLDEIDQGARDAATGLEMLDDAANSAGDGLEEIGEKLDAGNLMQAADTLSGVGDKLIEVGQSAMESAGEWDSATAKIQANLGLTAEEASKMEGIAKQVFEQGIADSVDTAAEAVMLCKSSFEDLSDTDLTNLSSQLVGISERTGTDLQENVRGARQLMKAFGVDGKEAMDLIAAGYQANLNSSGDFMDTLNEYAPLFSEAGFSAEQMLSILSSGMDNGALNTDKVADAVKELQIRLGDGTFEKNMGMFSQTTQNMFQEWKNGGATVAEVAESIGQDLQKMTPTEQQQALSALSTQFEDLGIDASVALLNTGSEFENVTGKAKEFSNATPSEKWQGSLNKISDSLSDIGDKVMTTLQPVLDVVAGFADGFSKLPGPIQTVVVVIGILISAFTLLAPAISAIMTIFGTLSTVALGPIIPIIAAVAAAIAGIILVIQNWGTISEWLGGVWEALKEALMNVWNGIVDFFSGVWEGITATIQAVWNGIVSFFSGVWEAIKSIFQTVLTIISTVITTYFNIYKTIITTVLTVIKTVITTAWNVIKTVVTTVLNGIKTVVTTVWNGIKTTVTTVTNAIKNGAVNGFNALVNGVKSILSKVTSVVKNGFQGAIDFITSLPRKAIGWGKDFINGLADGILSGVRKIVNAVKDIGNKIRSFLHFSRPDEGPLRDYETWMPDMLTGMADSIYKNIGTIQRAASAVSGAIDGAVTQDRYGSFGSASVPYSSSITVQGDYIILDGKVIGRTADKYITNNQVAKTKAKGGHA